MGDVKKEAQRNRESATAQRLVGVNADAGVIHASYRTHVRRASTLLLAMALLAGCGSKSSSSGKRLSADEYAAKADAVCKKYKAQTDKLARPANMSDLANVADQVVPILQHAQSDLRKLRPPANEQATADAWIKQFDVLVDDVKKIRDKAKDNDQAGIQALAEPALRHDQHANELAGRLGMTVCSKD
jgi:hypothetical protein